MPACPRTLALMAIATCVAMSTDEVPELVVGAAGRSTMDSAEGNDG